MMAFGIKDDNAFAEMLINEARRRGGAGFGLRRAGHFRASFATSMACSRRASSA